jgi:hexosaminidase
LGALSEVQWTQPVNKDYNDFLVRLSKIMEHYRFSGYNYSKSEQ